MDEGLREEEKVLCDRVGAVDVGRVRLWTGIYDVSMGGGWKE